MLGAYDVGRALFISGARRGCGLRVDPYMRSPSRLLILYDPYDAEDLLFIFNTLYIDAFSTRPSIVHVCKISLLTI